MYNLWGTTRTYSCERGNLSSATSWLQCAKASFSCSRDMAHDLDVVHWFDQNTARKIEHEDHGDYALGCRQCPERLARHKAAKGEFKDEEEERESQPRRRLDMESIWRGTDSSGYASNVRSRSFKNSLSA